MSAMRFAVLDLGSTSFQVVVFDATADGQLTPTLRKRAMLRLGATIAEGGPLPDEMVLRAVETVSRFRDLAERRGARILPIATAALRDAPDRGDLARKLDHAAGTPVRFLEGIQEARLMFAGIRASVAIQPGEDILALDLGGGSLELALGGGSALGWEVSLPLGVARLKRELVAHDPLTEEELEALRERIHSWVEPLAPTLGARERLRGIATGGTAGAIAQLVAARRWSSVPKSLNQMTVTKKELRAVRRDLVASTHEERLALPGAEERRADLLPVGATVLREVGRALDIPGFTLSGWGLREGVVLEALGLADLGAPPPRHLRGASVERLLHMWPTDRPHGRHVSRLAGDLFDATRALHGMEPGDRELLTEGAALHHIGTQISPGGFHRHGAYLVEHAGLRGFDPEEVAMLASLVRFHRGSGPKLSYPPYALLSEDRRRRTVGLVGLLRLAHALDLGPDGPHFSFGSDPSKRRLRIILEGGAVSASILDEIAEETSFLAKRLDVDVALLTPSGTPVTA